MIIWTSPVVWEDKIKWALLIKLLDLCLTCNRCSITSSSYYLPLYTSPNIAESRASGPAWFRVRTVPVWDVRSQGSTWSGPGPGHLYERKHAEQRGSTSQEPGGNRGRRNSNLSLNCKFHASDLGQLRQPATLAAAAFLFGPFPLAQPTRFTKLQQGFFMAPAVR